MAFDIPRAPPRASPARVRPAFAAHTLDIRAHAGAYLRIMNTTPFQRALSTLNATCAALDDLRPTGELRAEDIEVAKRAAQRAYRLLTGEDATTGAERMAGFEQTAAYVLQYRFALLTFDDAPAPSPKQLRDVTEARKQIRDSMLFLMKNAPEWLADAVISTCANSAERVGLRQFGIALLSAGEDV